MFCIFFKCKCQTGTSFAEKLDEIQMQGEWIMATSAEALAAVRALNSKVDALIDYSKENKDKLDECVEGGAGGGIPADVQADIDAIAAEAEAEGVKADGAKPFPPSEA